MKPTRRDFLKLTRAGALGAAVVSLGLPTGKAQAATLSLKTAKTRESTTICPFCGCGCGLIVSTQKGKVINIEGDPDHPVNEGSLCSKGMALLQVGVNDRRLDKVKYRAPGSDKWEEKSWEWALPRIAKNIKKTRDASFIRKENGKIVNRTDGLACLGGASLDNEECYLYSKLARAMGVTYLEHQARI